MPAAAPGRFQGCRPFVLAAEMLRTIAFVRSRFTPIPERTATKRLLVISQALLLLPSSVLAGPPFVTDDPERPDYLHWELYTRRRRMNFPGTSGSRGQAENNRPRRLKPVFFKRAVFAVNVTIAARTVGLELLGRCRHGFSRTGQKVET